VSPTEIAVSRLMQLKHDTQTIVICGKNEELQQRVTGIVGADNPSFQGPRLQRPHARTHENLRSFVGKPGGLTTSESLACGLPMVIISPIPGQEERNSDHLLEDGAAIKMQRDDDHSL